MKLIIGQWTPQQMIAIQQAFAYARRTNAGAILVPCSDANTPPIEIDLGPRLGPRQRRRRPSLYAHKAH